MRTAVLKLTIWGKTDVGESTENICQKRQLCQKSIVHILEWDISMNFLLKIKVSISCTCDKQHGLWYTTSQNMEVEYKLMAYGRKCGLGKCHPLSQTSTHPALHTVLPHTLPLCTSVRFFKAEAVSVSAAYLLKWYWPQPLSWQRRLHKQRNECNKHLIVWRKLSTLMFCSTKYKAGSGVR